MKTQNIQIETSPTYKKHFSMLNNITRKAHSAHPEQHKFADIKKHFKKCYWFLRYINMNTQHTQTIIPIQSKGHLSMSNSNSLTQQIHAILEQRQPMVARVTGIQQSLSPLLQTIQDIQCYRDQSLAENSGKVQDQWQALDTLPAMAAVQEARADLARLKERFGRKTLRIGVTGQSREGKSQMLQSLSGLSAQEIPTSSGGFTTGTCSLICHHNEAETYALVSFFSESEFLEQIIAPYYAQLKISAAPKNLAEFRQNSLPNPTDTGGETVALINQLREYQEHLKDYQALLNCSEKRISRDEILQHVAKHNPDTDEKYQTYRAVKLVKIYTPFPQSDIGDIALVDLPGLDEIKVGESERLIKTLVQDVDILLFVKMPKLTGDAWNTADMRLYQLAKNAVEPIDLEQCSFMVLNRHSDGKRDKRCDEMCQEARQNGIYTSQVIIANCKDANEAQQKILQPVLEYLAQNIQVLDQNYLNAKSLQLDDVRKEVMRLVVQMQNCQEITGCQISIEQTFSGLRKNFAQTFMRELVQQYLKELRERQDDNDEALADAVNKAIQAAREESHIPDRETLIDDHAATQSWTTTFNEQMHIMRTHLTAHFQELDTNLRCSVEEMKTRIVTILRHAGLANIAPELEDSHFLKALLKELNAEQFPALYKAIKNLEEFQLLYRGFIQHRIRDCLVNMYPDTTEFGLVNDKPNEIDPDQLIGRLENAYETTLYGLENELKSMLREPSKARYAIVEEFRDRIWQASDAQEQWRVFLDERKHRLWPELFAWQKLITQLQQYTSQPLLIQE